MHERSFERTLLPWERPNAAAADYKHTGANVACWWQIFYKAEAESVTEMLPLQLAERSADSMLNAITEYM